MIVALNLAACGRRDESSDTDTYAHDGAGPRPGETSMGNDNIPDTGQTALELPVDRSLFYGETLVIYALSRYSNNITAIANEYMRLNPDITIEIISFRGDLTRAIQETSIALGEIVTHAQAPRITPPVLIESSLVNPRDTHHFANWIPFINATHDFNDYYFFMNVIDAMAVDGFLYEFPLNFSFNVIATNYSIPGLPQAMQEYRNGITMYQLMGLMRYFNTTGYHPDMPDMLLPMYLWHNFDIWHGFTFFHHAPDSETGIADFNSQRLIDFLTHARETTAPDKIFGENFAPSLLAAATSDFIEIWRYFFFNVGMNDKHDVMPYRPNDVRDMIFGSVPLMFADATPIVNEHGELIITPTAAYVLSAHATPAQQDLAWDFMQFMASDAGVRAASRSMALQPSIGIVRERLPMMHINREAARLSIRENWLGPDSLWHDSGAFCILATILTATRDSEVAIPHMTHNWLDDIGDMPMVLAQTWPDTVRLTLQDFHNGMISAEEAAILIQGLIEFEMAGVE